MKPNPFRPLPKLILLGVSAVAGYAADNPKVQETLAPITVRGATFEMVRIPAGEFFMGSEEGRENPRHRVRVPAFDLGRTEITVKQFRAFVEATDYRTDAEKEGWTWVCCWSKRDGVNWRNPGFPQSDDDPVVALSWHDAVAFCKWLAAETGQGYRLPSEAEWEYAARAGTDAEYPPGLEQAAWYKENSDGRTHPVGRKQPTAWSLYDTLGNAWEWVADVWSDSYAGAPTDGSPRLDGGTGHKGFAPGDGRVLRGGAWGLPGTALRFAERPPFGSHERCNNSGFRIARSVQAAVK